MAVGGRRSVGLQALLLLSTARRRHALTDGTLRPGDGNATEAPAGRTVVLEVTSSAEALRVYVAGTAKWRSKAIVILPDTCGWEKSVLHVADRLASKGFVVAAADHFRGREWSASVSVADVHAELLEVVIPYLEEEYAASVVGLLGFGWGGQRALDLAHERQHVGAVVVVHGTALTTGAAALARVPVALYAARNDPDLVPLRAALERAVVRDSCEVRLFDGLPPSPCASSGVDWSDAATAAGVADVLSRTSSFFREHLNIFHAELGEKDEL